MIPAFNVQNPKLDPMQVVRVSLRSSQIQEIQAIAMEVETDIQEVLRQMVTYALETRQAPDSQRQGGRKRRVHQN
jgi:hypothetical protein